MLLHTTNDNQLFLHSHIVSNSSSLFMSMSTLILIYINIMDMKKTHVNLPFHIHVGGRGKK